MEPLEPPMTEKLSGLALNSSKLADREGLGHGITSQGCKKPNEEMTCWTKILDLQFIDIMCIYTYVHLYTYKSYI